MLDGTSVERGAQGVAKEKGREGQTMLTRRFTKPGERPLDLVEWVRRVATITDASGKTFFEQADVEVPAAWSQTATNVVVSKYFRGHVGQPGREDSVRQLIGRVVGTLTSWGIEGDTFRDVDEADTFRAELEHLLVHQLVSFNSPVWFNVGVEERPQCSACFINSVEDTMEGILALARTEGLLFKWGSGTGTNFSTLRSSTELLAGGGTASGPVSFMRGYDAFAGVIKSGGKTRRAAKMVILNADHPDVVEFVGCKAREEQKAWALVDAGYDGSFDARGGAYESIAYQNANHSVRVSDEFMDAVVADRDWHLRSVRTGEVMTTLRARKLMAAVSDAAWICGDPGIQFDTTINRWHTCPESGRINASNPCSEYMFLDDSACNLASLNLMAFRDEAGEFDADAFRHAVRTVITAQEIIVDNASYPTEAIRRNSVEYRPLGLGYANLGALLMARGLPYDSDAGRAFAGTVTSLMHGEAFRTSALLAARKGPFEGFARNRGPMLDVMRRHEAANDAIERSYVPHRLWDATRQTWRECLRYGEMHGYRNAQVTVLAPTGTIAFMMDCDTTGIEPEMALVKFKKLVGGGMLKLVNRTVPEALRRLGYQEADREGILDYLEEQGTIEGAPDLKDEHLPVFDCAFKPQRGSRSIAPRGHLRMMAAVQPFLSGAISKTVNVGNSATRQDLEEIYREAWRLGLKAIAVYRDGCKRSQPLSTKEEKGAGSAKPSRRELPDERPAMTHKFKVNQLTGYVTVGMYPDTGMPAEIFLNMGKEGGVVSGLLDAFATTVSLALQYGVPLQELVARFSHMKFEPSGFTGNPELPHAKSILDYLFRWLALKFLPAAEQVDGGQRELPLGIDADGTAERLLGTPARLSDDRQQAVMAVSGHEDAPACPECGFLTYRNGTCYRCYNCGATTGCS